MRAFVGSDFLSLIRQPAPRVNGELEMRILFAVIVAVTLASPAFSEEVGDCAEEARRSPHNYGDRCTYRSYSGSIHTYDLRIKKEHADEEDVFLDIPYANIRASGVILQLYYSSAVGKAQWLPFPDYQGVYIMPNNLLLPVKSWIDGGLPIGTFVRVVLITGK